jgi:hypothetical protein
MRHADFPRLWSHADQTSRRTGEGIYQECRGRRAQGVERIGTGDGPDTLGLNTGPWAIDLARDQSTLLR